MQQQENQVIYQAPPAPEKANNPFWYRNADSDLFNVTNGPSNPAIGITNISLRPASQAQLPHGILYNGNLSSIIGSFSFQVRVSKKSVPAPYISTVSTENGVDDKGNKKYWEHMNFNRATKAQILRFVDALMSGQGVQQQQVVQQQQYVQPQQVVQQQYAQPQQQYVQPQQQMQQQYIQPQQQMNQPNYGGLLPQGNPAVAEQAVVVNENDLPV